MYTAIGHTSTDINLGYTAVGYARLISLLAYPTVGYATAYRRITGLTTVKMEGSTQTTALAVTLFIKAVELIHPIIYKVRFTALDFILAE